jgi:hypothetical protein
MRHHLVRLVRGEVCGLDLAVTLLDRWIEPLDVHAPDAATSPRAQEILEERGREEVQANAEHEPTLLRELDHLLRFPAAQRQGLFDQPPARRCAGADPWSVRGRPRR